MDDKKRLIVGGGSAFLVAALVLNLLFGWYWSQEPDLFSVTTASKQRAIELGDQNQIQAIGFVSVSTLISLAETLLDKPGGLISNDVILPSIAIDNIKAWEYGVLMQVRDFTLALREDLSRSQSQSSDDARAVLADNKFRLDHKKWILPVTENEYKAAIKALKDYVKDLSDETKSEAQFYARADNLRSWLQRVSKGLGSLSQKLSASTGRRVINTDLAGDTAARQSSKVSKELDVQTPWLKIDDVFYEVRGNTWALYHLLKAVEIDFEEVLKKKAATASLKQIIRELESTQQTLWSPVVLNGDGMGLLANHSLVMANFVSRANAALIDLQELLAQG